MTEEKNDYFNDQQKSITLIDLFIVILKHKLLISAAVIIAVLMAFIYLNISMKSTPSKPSESVPQNNYSSEVLIELNMNIVERFSIICMSESISEKIFSKYNLSMLRYMIWDEKNKKWIIDKIYSWDERNKKLMINDKNNNEYMGVIPTIKIGLQKNFCHITFSCGDSEIPSKALNDYLIYISEYFRTEELDKINSKIDLYRKVLARVTDGTLKEKVADLLIAMELASNIKNNVTFYPYDVMPPTIVNDENEMKKLGSKGASDGKRKSIILISTGLAAFIFALLFVFFLENLQRMKKMNPEKFDLLKKYMRLRGDKKLK